jgi:hypothetical protein
VTTDNWITIKCHIQMLGHWFLSFLGFHILTTGNVFFFFLPMIQKKRKKHQLTQQTAAADMLRVKCNVLLLYHVEGAKLY